MLAPLLLTLMPLPAPPATDAATPLGHTTATPAEVEAYVAAGTASLVDVREQKEWDEGHLAAATLVPLSDLAEKTDDPAFAAELAKRLPKDRPVYTHCKSGGRCVLAAEPLRTLGYDVRPLKPGYVDLVAAGLKSADD